MKAELTKFRVKPGKSERVSEWIDYMHNNLGDILVNLRGEKVFVETIFRETDHDAEYIYWYSVEDDKRTNHNKDVKIDPKHIRFMDECIDKTYRPLDMPAEITMVQKRVSKVMS